MTSVAGSVLRAVATALGQRDIAASETLTKSLSVQEGVLASIATALRKTNNQAEMKELVKEAKDVVAKTNKERPKRDASTSNSNSNLVFVAAIMTNAQDPLMVMTRRYDFSGKLVGRPSQSIKKEDVDEFVHKGESLVSGSSGAVVYGNHAKEGAVQVVRAWLLAWSAVDNQLHVYVEAGSLDKIMRMTEGEIKTKLEKAGTTSYYLDNTTGALASATITADGNTVALGSVFTYKH